MNRINLSPLAKSKSPKELDLKKSTTPDQPESLFAWDVGEPRTESEISVFAPLDYEPNYAYPLIVWLHSDGQTSSQLQTVMTGVSVRNYVGVAPQAPIGNFQCGYFWEQDFDSIQIASKSIAESVSLAKSRFKIHPGRIFLAGSGGGGTMALRIGLRSPDQFAGVITLNGPMPAGQSPLAQWARCRNMPIFWSQCVHNRDGLDQAEMCQQFRFLYASGFLNVSVREYQSPKQLEFHAPDAINRWIMEQIETAIL